MQSRTRRQSFLHAFSRSSSHCFSDRASRFEADVDLDCRLTRYIRRWSAGNADQCQYCLGTGFDLIWSFIALWILSNAANVQSETCQHCRSEGRCMGAGSITTIIACRLPLNDQTRPISMSLLAAPSMLWSHYCIACCKELYLFAEHRVRLDLDVVRPATFSDLLVDALDQRLEACFELFARH